MNLDNYIYLSCILFAIGSATVLVRRNAIVVFMGVELMLNSANLAFVTFARMQGTLDGQVVALFVMLVAAADRRQNGSGSLQLPPEGNGWGHQLRVSAQMLRAQFIA